MYYYNNNLYVFFIKLYSYEKPISHTDNVNKIIYLVVKQFVDFL